MNRNIVLNGAFGSGQRDLNSIGVSVSNMQRNRQLHSEAGARERHIGSTWAAMNIALPRNLEDYVAELVQNGSYSRPDEVVSEALREHQARRQGREVVMTPELERLLDEGLENLHQAKTSDELRHRS